MGGSHLPNIFQPTQRQFTNRKAQFFSFERQNLFDDAVQVFVGHGRIRRHRYIAPKSFASVFHAFNEPLLCIALSSIFRRDIAKRRSNDFPVDSVTSGTAVISQQGFEIDFSSWLSHHQVRLYLCIFCAGRSWRFDPGLSGHDVRPRKRLQIIDQHPHAFAAYHTTIRGHPPRSAVENGAEDFLIPTAIAPTPIRETGTDPASASITVTTVAIHRGKQSRSGPGIVRIPLVRIAQLTGRRRDPAGPHMSFITYRRRCAALFAGRTRGRSPGISASIAGDSQQRDSECGENCGRDGHVSSHHQDFLSPYHYRPKIQIIPPWLVCRPSVLTTSAGDRTSAGSSERTSPAIRNQSPPMPAYTATYCLPSGA